MLFGVTAFELVTSAIVYSVTIETLVLGNIYNIISIIFGCWREFKKYHLLLRKPFVL